MKVIVGIFLVCQSFFFAAFAQEKTEDFTCSMPILLAPAIQRIRQADPTASLPTNEPRQCETQTFAFEIASFPPEEAESARYDRFVQVSCPELRCRFRLYVKNGIVMKIVRTDPRGAVTAYRQTLIEKIGAMKFADPSYLALSRKILSEVYAAEPVILRLAEGKYRAAITLTVAGEDVDVGSIKLENMPDFVYTFSYFKGKMENAALITGSEDEKRLFEILFSMTVTKAKPVLALANSFSRDRANGFECAFHADLGLHYYLPKKDRVFGEVTMWSAKGMRPRKYPLKVFQAKYPSLLREE